MSATPSPPQSSNTSPGKGASVKDFSREKLEKLFTDSVRKLKAKDKQLAEVSNERDVLAKQLSEGQDQAAELPQLQAQLKEQIDSNAHLRTQLEEAKTATADQSTQLETVQRDLHSRLEDSAQQIEMMQEQATALKNQIRELSENRDSAIQLASESLKEKLQELTAKSGRTESIARSARASASKAHAECQVLEGALQGSKAMLAKAEDDKLGLEARIQQLMVEAERSEGENKKKLEDLQKQLHQSMSPKSPTESTELEKVDVAALRAEFNTRINELKAREAELLKELEETKAHSLSREAEVDERVTQTQQELDVLLPELQYSQDTLHGSSSQTSLELYEARQMIAEKDLEVQGLEDRVAQAESALNVANAHIEEQSSAIASPLSRASPQSQIGNSYATLDAFLEPEAPEIKRSFSSRHSKEEQNDRIEKLESYVDQLEEEITSLRKLKDELVEVKAEKDRVENAVRNYLAEKPAEDAMREKELQTSRAETEQAQHQLEEVQAQKDALQVQLNELRKAQSEGNADESSPEASNSGQQAALEQELEAARAEVSRLTQRCSELESQAVPSQSPSHTAEDQSKLEKDLMESRKEAEALQKQVSELTERHHSETSAHEARNGDPETKRSTEGQAAKELQTLEAENKDLIEKLTATEATRDELQQQVKELRESLQYSTDQVEILKDQLKSNAEGGSKMEETAAKVSALQGEIRQLEASLKESDEKYSQTLAELQPLQESSALLGARNSQLALELEETHQSVRNCRSEIARLERDVQDRTEALEGSRAKLERKSEGLRAVTAELEELRNSSAQAETVEAAQKEVSQLTEAQESLKTALAKEKERAHRFIVDLKKRLEKSNKELKQAEANSLAMKNSEASMKQQLETQFEVEREELMSKIRSAEGKENESSENAKHWEQELSTYKARAHSLLKSKDQDLKTAKEAAESAVASELTEARRHAQEVQDELQKVRLTLQEAEASHQEKIQEAEQQIEQATSDLRDAWEEANASAESSSQAVEQWRRRYESLESRMEALRTDRKQPREPPSHLIQKHTEEVQALLQKHRALQEEFSSYKESSQQIAESRDRELERVLGLNAGLKDEMSVLRARRESVGLPGGDEDDWNSPRHNRQAAQDDRASFYSADSRTASGSFANNLGMLSRSNDFTRHYQDEGWNMSEGRAPSDWAFMQDHAQQAVRDEELKVARKRAAEMEAEVADLAREVELRQEQEDALKEALREAEREKSRTSLADKQRLDIEYLKNTVLKLYETGQAHVLLPAISTLLHLSPAELKRCQDGLAKQAELFSDASTALDKPQPAAQPGYLGGWTSWAFGESES